jgi:pimeloyl-ACP methyl ester carboxylesterase
LRTIDFCIESNSPREIWGTLTLPEKIKGPAVIMAHGFLGFKDWSFFPWLAETFASEGFPAVRFNFSGSGMGPQTDGSFTELEAFQKDTISKQVEDLHSVISCVTNGKLDLPAQEKVFLWGHSRGGGVCLLGAAGHPFVQGIAVWATIARVNRYLFDVKQSWRKQGFSPVESSRTGQLLKISTDFLDDAEKWGKEGDIPTYLHNLKIPILLVHGSEDTSVKAEESESLAAVYRRARLAILAGADHKFNAAHPFGEAPEVLAEAARLTVEFFKECI